MNQEGHGSSLTLKGGREKMRNDQITVNLLYFFFLFYSFNSRKIIQRFVMNFEREQLLTVSFGENSSEFGQKYMCLKYLIDGKI